MDLHQKIQPNERRRDDHLRLRLRSFRLRNAFLFPDDGDGHPEKAASFPAPVIERNLQRISLLHAWLKGPPEDAIATYPPHPD